VLLYEADDGMVAVLRGTSDQISTSSGSPTSSG
jgi:hypothetical protein